MQATDLHQEFEGTVRGISNEGLGVIESPSKKVYFVAGSWPGDKIRVRVTESTSRYGYGEMIELIEASPDRVKPDCQHQGWGKDACGGCPWMIGSYESQLRHKQHRLKHMLDRGHLTSELTVFKSLRPSPKVFGYRNRAQLKSDGNKIGFMAVGTKQIVDVTNCPVLSEKNQQTLTTLRSRLPESQWQPQKGHSFIKLEINDETPAIKVVPNQRLIFQQANDEQNAYMKEWIETKLSEWKAAGLKGSALELFCGAGNFTKALLPSFSAPDERVFAVEWKGEALEKLKTERFPNLSISENDLFRPGVWADLKKWIESEGTAAADVRFLFLDPPRDGLKFRHGLMAEFPAIEKIIYVSCDVATLARDLQYFKDKGFKLLEVQGVDQFPHTSHLETLCTLSR